MISINLLDYNGEVKKIAIQKVVVNAIGAIFAVIILIVVYWCFLKFRTVPNTVPFVVFSDLTVIMFTFSR